MADDWTPEELRAATRAYLWMLRSANAGTMPNKAAVRRALLAGPLKERNDQSLEFRFRNISSVLDGMRREWLKGYRPARQVGANVTKAIASFIADYESNQRHHQRVTFLAAAIPPETIRLAASRLAQGEPFPYADSIAYDAIFEGKPLSPKAVIGYAGLLHYGAPLLSEDFAGGEETKAFEKLRTSGIIVSPKLPKEAQPESDEFRAEVRKRKQKEFAAPPVGQQKPKKVVTTTTAFVRDPEVVAFVEKRANGACEHCGKPAPFFRKDGTPYLEVHHIEPLAEQGTDTVENAAALCPNCHRECHHGENAPKLRDFLLTKIAALL